MWVGDAKLVYKFHRPKNLMQVAQETPGNIA